MDSETFEEVVTEQIKRCEETLIVKAREYATEDRLHNFKVAASITGETPKQALAGFMAKHTVSIYDMCKSDASFTPDVWDEKLTDHINYLILLRALVQEEITTREPTRG